MLARLAHADPRHCRYLADVSYPRAYDPDSSRGSVGVLLTGADGRFAVAACESLSRAGYRVGTVSIDSLAPSHWSRFSAQRFRASDPQVSSRDFAADLAQIARKGEFATILCGGDRSLIAVSSNRDMFDDAVKLGLPSEEVVESCINKASLAEKARQVGLSAPETIVCQDPAEARRRRPSSAFRCC